MHDGEKATSEQDRDRKRRARRMLCLECMRVRTFRKASDHTVKQSRTALMISEKLDCRGLRKGRRWRHRDREMSEKSGWELKVGVEWK